MTEAFPLAWPQGWPRTKTPQSSRFDVTFAAARDGLLEEIRMMGGTLPVLSSNVALRRDGLPYANNSEPTDRGVAVYFMWRGEQRVFACDRWDKVKDNIRALQKTIEAIRGIERWGASDMLDRAFAGFTALPAPGATAKRPWREVLGFPPASSPDREGIDIEYRRKAKTAHPDTHGGSHDAMSELNRAREEALREIG